MADTLNFSPAITHDWIVSVGGPEFYIGGGFNLWVYPDSQCIEIQVENKAPWYGCSHEVQIPFPGTQDQFRTLAACLGIELKEPPGKEDAVLALGDHLTGKEPTSGPDTEG